MLTSIRNGYGVELESQADWRSVQFLKTLGCDTRSQYNVLNDFAYIRLAMIQLDCDKDVKSAEASLAKAMELNPTSKWVWLWKGIVALEFKSDYAAARECCRKAIELDPKFAEALPASPS